MMSALAFSKSNIGGTSIQTVSMAASGVRDGKPVLGWHEVERKGAGLFLECVIQLYGPYGAVTGMDENGSAKRRIFRGCGGLLSQVVDSAGH
jgi:hypothetical protein